MKDTKKLNRFKKVFPIFLSLFLCFMPFASLSAFAYSGGLLDGQILHVASTTSFNESTDNPTLGVTDNNTASVLSLSPNSYVYYHFASPVSISGYEFDLSSSYYFNLVFFDSGLNVIKTIDTTSNNNNQKYNISAVSNVSYIALKNTTSSAQNIKEFDVFGTAPFTHDEISALNVSQSGGSANISYSIPSGNTHYTGSKIYRDGVLIATQDSTATSFVDSVDYSSSYVYKVTALYDDSFETSGATYNLTTTAVPVLNPVVGLSDSLISDHGVHLSWSAPTDPSLAGFKVYQDGTLIHTLVLPDTSYDVSGLSGDTSYNFTVTSYDDSGNESVGSDIAVKTLAVADTIAPDVVNGLKVTNGDSALYVSWDDSPATDLAGYNVYVNGVLYNTNLINGNFVTVTDLTNDTSYDISVTAMDSSGNESSASSAIVGIPKAGLVPVIQTHYSLQDVSDGISQWFKSYWLILAFATSIPLSFYIASRIKLMFLD